MARKYIPENNISLVGETMLSSDKSLSIRAILFASIAYGVSNFHINNPGEDAQSAIGIIKKLGIKVIKNKNNYIVFGQGIGYPSCKKQIIINCHNSGTAMRLSTPLIAGSKVNAKIIGDPSLSSRPYRLEFLKDFLMDVKPSRKNYLPLIVKGNENSIQADIKITKKSAQQTSAAVLSALMSYGITNIEGPLVRDHTTRLLQHLGYPIKTVNKKDKQLITVRGRQLLKPILNYNIPCDPSSSAFLISIAILTRGSKIKIKNVLINEHRIGFIKILKKAGAKIQFKNKRKYFGEYVADIEAVYSPNLQGLNVKSTDVPSLIDELPVLFIVAMFCKSKSYFYDLGELQVKESKRLDVMEKNLKLIGAKVSRKKDNLFIDGITEEFFSSNIPEIKNFKKDHRIALAMAVFAAVSRKKIIIHDFDSINVSFPNFLKTIEELKTKKFKSVVLAADGPVASGKTSILKHVTKEFGSQAVFIDSGTLYRLLTLIHLNSKKKKVNPEFLIKQIQKINLKVLQNPKLHSNEVSNNVSKIAKIKKIRRALLPIQRHLILNCEKKYVLVSGRDIGSVVTPNNFSDIKLFIDCPVKVRAKRRYLELKSKNKEENVEFTDILKALKERDYQDKNRKVSPLVKTKDAMLIFNNKSPISPVRKIKNLLKEIK